MYKLRQMPARVSQSLSLPAPTGGLNDLDPLSNMDAAFLLDCMNFYPDTGLMVVRPGYQEWTAGIDRAVETIMYYNGIDGEFQRFATTATAIYNITSSGLGAPLPSIVALTYGQWEFVNYATAAGQYLVCVNGHDVGMLYNGTTWIYMSEVATPGAPGEIAGINPAKFSDVIVHKGRLWFIERDSMVAWYLPIDSVGGIAEPFFLGGIFRRGGNLLSMARWSSDTGEGLDDRLIFVTSTGEIASYAGSDPSDANDWSLDSVFFVAPPLGKRAITEYGGDLLMLCRRGLIPMSSLIAGKANEVLFSEALTRRISRTLIQLTSQANPPFPAEVAIYNDAAWVVVNIFDGSGPAAGAYNRMLAGDAKKPIQLVMNFLTGAWGKSDIPVRTVCSIDRLFFMGTEDGRVLVMTPGSYVDNIKLDGTDGVPIEAMAMGAYTYLGDQTSNKHAKFVRPIFHSEVKPSFTMRVLPDFRLDPFVSTPLPNLAKGNAKWDLSNWDEANWGSYENVYRPWVSANVLGYAFAWQLRVNTSSPLGVAAVQWIWESGGFI